MIVKGMRYSETVASTHGSFVIDCQFKYCNRPASGRPLQKEGLNCLGKVKVSFIGGIPVVDWLATATGNFGVEYNSDLVAVEQL